MAAQATPKPMPPRNIPPWSTGQFASHQRLDRAQLSLLQDETYMAIGDSFMDTKRLEAKACNPFHDNVEELWVDK